MCRKIASFVLLFFTCFLHSQPLTWNLPSKENAKLLQPEAVSAIMSDADKFLKTKIGTVMDKELIPASGDKHDYMSGGIYWWPNPDTKDGLPYIRKDGVINPQMMNLDSKTLGNVVKSVRSLSLAYYLSSDEKYAVKAVDNLKIWFVNSETKMNPNLNYGQVVLGTNNGKGRPYGIIDTYILIGMLESVELLRYSTSFKDADKQALVSWFSAYLDWLLTSDLGQQESRTENNHSVAFDAQAIRYALFVNKTDVARKIINDFPQKRLFKQVNPDGAQPLELARTTAFHYSNYNLMHFLDIAAMAKSLNIDVFNATSTDGRNIKKSIEFLIPYLGKQVNDFPYQQIKEWDKVQQEFCWTLMRADSFVPKPAYKEIYSKHLPLNGESYNYIIYSN